MAQEALTQISPSKLAPIREALAKAQSHFAMALPSTVAKYLTPERLTKIALAACSRDPKLLACTSESVLRSVMEAASLGLEPSGGVLGQAYLVPYRNNKNNTNEAQLIVGYRGLISLARRSGQIDDIEAHVVHERDTFVYRKGLNQALDHEPFLGDDPGEVTAAYAIAHIKGSARPHVEVMSASEIIRIRDRSRAKDSGPWKTDHEEMCRKTVIRRLCKYLPMSSELVRAMEVEDAAETGTNLRVVDQEALFAYVATKPDEKPQTKRIAEKVKGQQKAAQQEPAHDPDTGEVFDYGPPPMTDEEAEEAKR